VSGCAFGQWDGLRSFHRPLTQSPGIIGAGQSNMCVFSKSNEVRVDREHHSSRLGPDMLRQCHAVVRRRLLGRGMPQRDAERSGDGVGAGGAAGVFDELFEDGDLLRPEPRDESSAPP